MVRANLGEICVEPLNLGADLLRVCFEQRCPKLERNVPTLLALDILLMDVLAAKVRQHFTI